jgi:hypothetical protein
MAETVTRLYTGFRGVDFRGEEIALVRSPDSVNMWKDYRETESIRTRPGMEQLLQLEETVHGIFFYKSRMLVHAGKKLVEQTEDGLQVLYTGLEEQESAAFIYADIWYFKDGANYLRYDGTDMTEVAGYVPTTSIARKPGGGGTTYEDVNLLTGRRKNTFLADGESVEYHLDARDIDPDFLPIVKVNGEPVTNFAPGYSQGTITFPEPPAAPLTDGRDNVEIEYRKTARGAREKILGCRLLQVFDNRVFFAGNPEHPNTMWHSSLDNPEYCSDLDYYNEGMDPALIRGLVAGNNVLWVFREASGANTTVFYHTPSLDAEYGKIYPSVHSSISTGCAAKAVNFNDDIVFFSNRGMEGIGGDITTEQAVLHRSTMVDRKLTAEKSYKDMLLAEWDGYLLVFIGSRCYAADSRGVFANGNTTEYEWFYWEMEAPVTCACTEGNVLYLGTGSGVYTLTGTEKHLESHWVTPKDRFDAPHKLKTSNKRGCVAEATGDIFVYAKVEDTDFEYIGSNEEVRDYFVSRIKRKKFKDIQLKFSSRTRFSLESITLQCFIGGYIKR